MSHRLSHARLVPLLFLLVAAAVPWRLAAQCSDGSPPPCTRSPVRAPAPNTVAVLYFDNLSSDTGAIYLADGLTEEIIVRLGQVRRLEVRSRYEVQRLRGRPGGDPAALGRELNAANIVTGSVQAAGHRVRVRVELVRSANRSRLWGDVFDRSSDDVLDIEQQVASAIVQGIAGQLLPEERESLARRPTRSAVAYDRYLRGRELLSRFDELSLRRSIGLFEQAVALDSTFVTAQASIAQAWSNLADDWVPPREAYPQARAAAQRALQADSGNAEAWANLAAVALWYDWNPARADSLARRAIALDARSSLAHLIHAEGLRNQGANGDVIVEYQRAFDLDSLSEETTSEVVSGLWQARQFDSAVALARRFQRAVPMSVEGYRDEAQAFLAQGDCAGALPSLQRARATGDSDLYMGAGLLHCQSQDEAARLLITSRIARWEQNRVYFRAGLVARIYALLGDRDEALRWLERAMQAREATLAFLGSARWDPLRIDPRFTDLVRRAQLVAAQEP